MKIETPAFPEGGEIPEKNTQEGVDLSPEVRFVDVPANAKSLVLIADDPDAPDPAAPKCVWLHWLVVNLPARCPGLAEGAKALPQGALTTVNDSGDLGWSGPRPPIGVHRYFFHLYALDTVLDLAPGFTRSDAENAMAGHVVAEAHTFGTYLLSTNR